MTKSNGIASLKQAAKLLNRHAPDGESLAYINPEEARLLKALRGAGSKTRKRSGKAAAAQKRNFFKKWRINS